MISEFASELENLRAEINPEIEQGENEHQQFLKMYYRGDFILNAGLGGFCQGQMKWYQTLFCSIVRIILFLVAAAIFSPANPIPYVLYCVAHIVLIVVGRKVKKKYSEKLFELSCKWDEIRKNYTEAQFEILDVSYGGACYPDGIEVVNNGRVNMRLPNYYGYIRIFRKSNQYDLNELNELRKNYEFYEKNVTEITKNIASAAVQRKYVVVTGKHNERVAIKYISPSLQVDLTTSPYIQTLCNMEIKDNMFSANSTERVCAPDTMDFSKKEPLSKYFDDTDKYCRDMYEMCTKAHDALAASAFRA